MKAIILVSTGWVHIWPSPRNGILLCLVWIDKGRHRFGKVLTLTIEQMLQLAQDFLENDFQVVARETKCFHQGDPYGEIQSWMYPRDKLELMDKNPYIKSIK